MTLNSGFSWIGPTGSRRDMAERVPFLLREARAVLASLSQSDSGVGDCLRVIVLLDTTQSAETLDRTLSCVEAMEKEANDLQVVFPFAAYCAPAAVLMASEVLDWRGIIKGKSIGFAV